MHLQCFLFRGLCIRRTAPSGTSSYRDNQKNHLQVCSLLSRSASLSLFLFSSIIMIEHCFVYLTALYKRRSSRTLYVQLLGSARFEPLPRSPQPCLNFGREYQQGIFNSRRYDAVHTFDETKKRNFYNTTQGSLRMVFSILTAKTPVMQLEIWHFS